MSCHFTLVWLSLKRQCGVRPLGFQLCAIRLGQRERRAVIDRGFAHRDLALAAAIQFIRGLIRRIQPPTRFQLLGSGLMRIGALHLPREEIMGEAEPCKVLDDRRFVFRLRTLGVGIIDAQKEFSTGLVREQPVDDSRPRIADMQQACG
jgi:hypothetical protein